VAEAGRALDREVVAVEGVEVEEPRMMSLFTSIKMGPRQFEFPPNIPVYGLRRAVESFRSSRLVYSDAQSAIRAIRPWSSASGIS
jgi:hypothetical protein